MIRLYDGGVYLNAQAGIIPDGPEAQQSLAKAGIKITKEAASDATMAWSVLESHNTSGSKEKLKIRFDKLTSHDITFVGISPGLRTGTFPDPLCSDQLSQFALCRGRNHQ